MIRLDGMVRVIERTAPSRCVQPANYKRPQNNKKQTKGVSNVEAATKALNLGLVALICFFFGTGFAHADTIYVGVYNGSSTIEKFDSNGHGTVFASTGLSNPQGLAFDNSGNLYVANYFGGSIEKFDSSGNGTVFASTGLNDSTGLAFDSGGNLYVANWENNSIEKFDSSGQGSTFANDLTGVSHPEGLAFDSGGNLYVADTPGDQSASIWKFDSSGHGSVFTSTGLSYPTGLAFDNSGNLYVANQGNNTIEKFDASGNGTIFAAASSGLDYPQGLDFDSSGNLYVTCENPLLGEGWIMKFDSSGNGSVFASGVDGPGFITVQVPEPASWAMVALGIGTLLGGRRLRRSS
jgi:sugar lactone lactonase YvrE